MKTTTPFTPPAPKPHPALWVGLLGAPVAWSLQLELTYALTGRVCNHHGPLLLHLATLVLFVAALAGLRTAWREWNSVGRAPHSDEGPTGLGRTRFMSLVGVMTGSLFSLVIAAQWVAVAMLDPCPK